MAFLSKQELLARFAAKTEDVEVDGLGTFKIRHLDASFMDRIATNQGKLPTELMREAILQTVLAEDGSPYFSSMDEVKSLQFEPFTKLQTAINKLNRLDEVGDATAKN